MKRCLAGFLCLFSLSLPAVSAEVTFEFDAVLVQVDAAARPAFAVGDTVQGSYTFTEVTSTSGSYTDVIVGAEMTINGLTFTKVPTAGGTGNIFVRNDVCCTRDGYNATFNTSDTPTVLGDQGQVLTPKSVIIDLWDSTATVFDDQSLPLVPPAVEDFDNVQQLIIRFDDPSHFSDAVLVGQITSLNLAGAGGDGSGVYAFNFSTAGTGTFRYDGADQDVEQLRYDFGAFGSGSTFFGPSLTTTVFGNPPGSTVIQDNTFFSLSGGSANGLRLRINGTFCVEDASGCGTGGLPAGTYQIALLVPGETPPGMGVTSAAQAVDETGEPVEGAPQVVLTFNEVVSGGKTTVVVSSTGPALPAGFALGGTSTYLDIATDAAFVPPVEVCIEYDETGVLNEAALTLQHFESGEWIDITKENSPDTVANVICGLTNSFSVFATLELIDHDGDGVLDVDDNCPATSNPAQIDTDLDGTGDLCDADDDNDGVEDGADNCPFTANPDQSDADDDGHGDACDLDLDGDGHENDADNCPNVPNPFQTDTDGDGAGDACDTDDDNDGVCDAAADEPSCAAGPDNCAVDANPDQSDFDGDGIGDVCDADVDNDGIDDTSDNCLLVANPGQDDTDGDGDGDACDADDDNDGAEDVVDNCPLVANADQVDMDGDGAGDACDGDLDGDDVENDIDNCPVNANFDQFDFDGDGVGDACDGDVDGDGVLNDSDICAATPSDEVVQPGVGCSLDQLCPCDGPRGTTSAWRNHGKYVSCMAHATNEFVDAALINEAEKNELMSAAGESSCGKKVK